MEIQAPNRDEKFPYPLQSAIRLDDIFEACAAHRATCFAYCRRFERICDHVDADGLKRFRRISSPRAFRERTMLFDSAAPAKEVYLVESGLANLCRFLPDGRRQVIDILGPGEIVNLQSLWGATDFSAHAITSLQVTAIRTSDFIEFVNTYPEAATKLFFVKPGKINSLNRRIVMLGRKRANERMGEFLLMLRRKLGMANAENLRLPMSRSDIADYLGLTVETVSRALADLRTAGFIEVPRWGEIVYLDPAGLAKYSSMEE